MSLIRPLSSFQEPNHNDLVCRNYSASFTSKSKNCYEELKKCNYYNNFCIYIVSDGRHQLDQPQILVQQATQIAITTTQTLSTQHGSNPGRDWTTIFLEVTVKRTTQT